MNFHQLLIRYLEFGGEGPDRDIQFKLSSIVSGCGSLLLWSLNNDEWIRYQSKGITWYCYKSYHDFSLVFNLFLSHEIQPNQILFSLHSSQFPTTNVLPQSTGPPFPYRVKEFRPPRDRNSHSNKQDGIKLCTNSHINAWQKYPSRSKMVSRAGKRDRCTPLPLLGFPQKINNRNIFAEDQAMSCFHLQPEEASLMTLIWKCNTVSLGFFFPMAVVFGSILCLWAIQSPVSGHPYSTGHELFLMDSSSR